MQNVIASAMAVLGTLLVISGGVVIVSRALNADAPGGDADTVETAPANAREKFTRVVKDIPPADRLIGWGIVLLVLAAVAAGAISFNLGANAGTR